MEPTSDAEGRSDVRRSYELYSLCKILYKGGTWWIGGCLQIPVIPGITLGRIGCKCLLHAMDSFPSVCVCRTMETGFRCIYEAQIDDRLS